MLYPWWLPSILIRSRPVARNAMLEPHPAWGDYGVMVSRTRGQSKSICVNYDFGEWSILMT
jgi:hypothetical protein